MNLGRGSHTPGEPELGTARGQARGIRRASLFWPRMGPRLPARQVGLTLPVSLGANPGWAEVLCCALVAQLLQAPRQAELSARPSGPFPHAHLGWAWDGVPGSFGGPRLGCVAQRRIAASTQVASGPGEEAAPSWASRPR